MHMHRYNKLAIKTRCFNTAKIKYLFTPDELEMHQAIASVFEKFDTDGSGTLEISELYSMFQKNNIDITMKDLQQLFKIVDEDRSGTLDLLEFKAFTMSDLVKDKFRKIITELRMYEKYKHPEKRALILPYNFSALLSFLAAKGRQEKLREDIFKK